MLPFATFLSAATSMHLFRPCRRLAAVLAIAGTLASTPGLEAQPAAQQVPERFGFTVLERVPQSRENFVQGLQIVGDTLYVGTGLHGESRLMEYEFPAMKLRRQAELPANLFGEGVTRLDDRIYQLTYRARRLLIYDAGTLERVATASIATEGWGITHDGESLIYSDGSASLYFLDPDGITVRRTLTVTVNGRPLPRLNELEYVDGQIWANVWTANQIVRIDPGSGAVTAIADLSGLLPREERTPDTDVLNGIAWDERAKALWVTGKRWPWIYRIRLEARP
ncbi:MAG: glutaminyl-peptide cyclotransferase [Halieaceae bacterium]|nr:glutaminyl-peptide cyclotransferase [Halieaceae bacterium]